MKKVRSLKSVAAHKAFLMAGVTLSSLVVATAATAQDGQSDDVIVVEGVRKTIQDSLDLKRNNTSVVDGLSADDIGDLPALSICLLYTSDAADE